MSNLFDRLSYLFPSNPRVFWWLYFCAFGVVVIELLISLSLINYEARQLKENAKYITLAGRQSMLSQRIVLRIEHLHDANATITRPQLHADIDEFEKNYQQHLAALSDLDNADLIDPGLDPRFGKQNAMRQFVAQARHAADVRLGEAELEEFRKFVSSEVLPRTEALIATYRSAYDNSSAALNRTFNNAIAIAIAILCLEAVFVFLPAQRMLIRAFRQIEDKNENLKKQNALIEAEKLRLQDAIADANALRQEQAEFTYAISHDLKSPANTIKMVHGELCELLAEHDDEEIEMFLDLLISTTERMVLLVEDVLDYTTTLGEIRVMEKVDLNILFQNLTQDLSGDIKAADGQISVGQLPVINGRPGQLRMLFQNLVSNGIKFRAKGVASRIDVSCLEDSNNAVSIQIQDNGIGIAKDDQEKVFGLFNRLHLREDYPGTGLGLALCRRVAANHSGKIRLNSAPGQGSKFIITFPKRQIL